MQPTHPHLTPSQHTRTYDTKKAKLHKHSTLITQPLKISQPIGYKIIDKLRRNLKVHI